MTGHPVTGTLELDDGGNGTVAVVLTRLRSPTKKGCRIYGATVAGTLRVSSDTAA